MGILDDELLNAPEGFGASTRRTVDGQIADDDYLTHELQRLADESGPRGFAVPTDESLDAALNASFDTIRPQLERPDSAFNELEWERFSIAPPAQRTAAEAPPTSLADGEVETWGYTPQMEDPWANYGWGIKNAFMRGMVQLGAVADVAQGDVQELAAGQAKLAQYGLSPEDEKRMQEFQKQEGFWESIGFLATNPALAVQVVAESLPVSLPTLAGGAVGSIAGPVGAGTGAAVGSFSTEYFLSLKEVFQQEGVNLSDPQALKAAFGDEQLMSKARDHAIKRGVPIAMFDAVSMGLAGKIYKVAKAGKAAASAPVSMTALGAAGEITAQAGAGAAGEAGAQLSSEGRISSMPDIAAEAVGEIVPGVVEAGIQSFASREKQAGTSADTDVNTDTAAPAVPQPTAALPTEEEIDVEAEARAQIVKPDVKPTEPAAPEPAEPSAQQDLFNEPPAEKPPATGKKAAKVEAPATEPEAAPAEDDFKSPLVDEKKLRQQLRDVSKEDPTTGRAVRKAWKGLADAIQKRFPEADLPMPKRTFGGPAIAKFFRELQDQVPLKDTMPDLKGFLDTIAESAPAEVVKHLERVTNAVIGDIPSITVGEGGPLLKQLRAAVNKFSQFDEARQKAKAGGNRKLITHANQLGELGAAVRAAVLEAEKLGASLDGLDPDFNDSIAKALKWADIAQAPREKRSQSGGKSKVLDGVKRKGLNAISNKLMKAAADVAVAIAEFEAAQATEKPAAGTKAEPGPVDAPTPEAPSQTFEEKWGPINRSTLNRKKKSELVAMAESEGVDTAGVKKDLVDRLTGHFTGKQAAAEKTEPAPKPETKGEKAKATSKKKSNVEKFEPKGRGIVGKRAGGSKTEGSIVEQVGIEADTLASALEQAGVSKAAADKLSLIYKNVTADQKKAIQKAVGDYVELSKTDVQAAPLRLAADIEAIVKKQPGPGVLKALMEFGNAFIALEEYRADEAMAESDLQAMAEAEGRSIEDMREILQETGQLRGSVLDQDADQDPYGILDDEDGGLPPDDYQELSFAPKRSARSDRMRDADARIALRAVNRMRDFLQKADNRAQKVGAMPPTMNDLLRELIRALPRRHRYTILARRLLQLHLDVPTYLMPQLDIPGFEKAGGYYQHGTVLVKVRGEDQTHVKPDRRKIGLRYSSDVHGDGANADFFVRTFLHESVHAATHLQYFTHQNFQLAVDHLWRQAVGPALNFIKGGVTKEQHAQIMDPASFEGQELREKIFGRHQFYGLTHPVEFIAEAFTHPEFQQYLAALETRSHIDPEVNQYIAASRELHGYSRPSLLAGFIHAIKKMLGYSSRNNVLEEIIIVSDFAFNEEGEVREIAEEIRAGAVDYGYFDYPLSGPDRPVLASKAFRDWFRGSRVVDVKGAPLRVYHGTQADFDSFAPVKGNRGIYFTPDPGLASAYAKTDRTQETMDVTKDALGGRVYPVYLSVKNPFYIDPPSGFDRHFSPSGDLKIPRPLPRQKLPEGVMESYSRYSSYFNNEAIEAFKAAGYDGIINYNDGEVVVFDASQVKSAVGNQGTFNPGIPSLVAGPDRPTAATAPNDLLDQALAEQGPIGRAIERLAQGIKNLPRKTNLGFMSRDVIERNYRDLFSRAAQAMGLDHNPLTRYVQAKQRSSVLARDYAKRAHDVLQRTQKLSKEHRAKLFALMRDATLGQVWPDVSLRDPKNAHLWTKPNKKTGYTKMKKTTADKAKRARAAYLQLAKENPEAAQLLMEMAALTKEIQDAKRSKSLAALGRSFELDATLVDKLSKVTKSSEVDRLFPVLSADALAKLSPSRKDTKEQAKAKTEAREKNSNNTILAKTAKDILRHGYVPGPYFPLRRYGDYVVSTTDEDEGDKYVSMHSTPAEANRIAELLRAQGRDVKVTTKVQSNAITPDIDAVAAEITSRIKGPEAESTRSRVQAAILDALAANTAYASQLKRFGIDGVAASDMGRALEEYVYISKFTLGDLETAHDVQQALRDMKKVQKAGEISQADSETIGLVVNEIAAQNREEAADRERSAVQKAIGLIGFFNFLGAPAYWALNSTQTYTVTLPYLGAKWGPLKGSRQLLRAQQEVLAAVSKALQSDDKSYDGFKAQLSPGVRKLVENLEEANIIQSTIAHEFGDMLSDSWVTNMREALGPVGKSASAALWAMEKIPEAVEHFNRISTGLAIYRLTNGDIAAVHDGVQATQFNYDSSNRARLLKTLPIPAGGGARAVVTPIMMFKTYGVGLTRLLYGSMLDVVYKKGGRAEALKMAGGLIASHTLFGGVAGGVMLAPVAALLATFNAVFREAGSEFDPEEAIEEFLRENANDMVAQLVRRGLPAAVGVDMSKSINLGNLLWLSDERLDLADYGAPKEALANMLGPVAQYGLSSFQEGYWLLSDDNRGNWADFLAAIVPLKAFRGVVKGVQYEMEGVQTGADLQLLEPEKINSFILMALGFRPTEISATTERYYGKEAREARRSERKSQLVERLLTADPADRDAVWADVHRFNASLERRADWITRGDVARLRSLRRSAQRQFDREPH